MIEAIVALVVVLLAGVAFLAYRHRSERGIESGISSFRRELSALAPRHPGTAPAPEEEDDDVPDAEASDSTGDPAGDPAGDDD